MTKAHMKRIAAPKTWPISRKKEKFISRPTPKGQTMGLVLPAVVLMREVLKLTETAKQTRRVFRNNDIKVNGKRIYGTDSAIGFMDVVSIGPDHYRILINKKNILTVVPIKKNEMFTLQKITGKTCVKKGKTQLNCESGYNFLSDKKEYNVGDTVAIANNKVTDHYPMKSGAPVMITAGSHIGTVGNLKGIEGQVVVVISNKDEIRTLKKYAFVVGKDKPAISLG